MIKTEHIDLFLLTKETLSSGGGFFPESMAPCLGGPMHGKLFPLRVLNPVYEMSFESKETGLRGKQEHIYKLFPVFISLQGSNETCYVFRHTSPYSEESSYSDTQIDRLFEAWMPTFYEQTYGEL